MESPTKTCPGRAIVSPSTSSSTLAASSNINSTLLKLLQQSTAPGAAAQICSRDDGCNLVFHLNVSEAGANFQIGPELQHLGTMWGHSGELGIEEVYFDLVVAHVILF